MAHHVHEHVACNHRHDQQAHEIPIATPMPSSPNDKNRGPGLKRQALSDGACNNLRRNEGFCDAIFVFGLNGYERLSAHTPEASQTLTWSQEPRARS
jgi:hypothetical protein